MHPLEKILIAILIIQVVTIGMFLDSLEWNSRVGYRHRWSRHWPMWVALVLVVWLIARIVFGLNAIFGVI